MKKLTFLTFIICVIFCQSGFTQNNNSDFFVSQNSSRIKFTKSGTYKIQVVQSTGVKSEYSICFEVSDGGTRPANPCNKNARGTYQVGSVQAGNTLTIWTKDCSTCPGGEANLTERIWTDNTHTQAQLTWTGSGNFRVVVLVTLVSQYDNQIH